ncbi:MAG: hypothetical protein HFF84_12120 [Oscillibacter sp.]|nr:hypothetical protein [Oscillibacter sp.]
MDCIKSASSEWNILNCLWDQSPRHGHADCIRHPRASRARQKDAGHLVVLGGIWLAGLAAMTAALASSNFSFARCLRRVRVLVRALL